MRNFIASILFICLPNLLCAQNTENKLPKYVIKKTTEAITLDGEDKESIWSEIPTATEFVKSFPIDTGFAKSNTAVKMCFDEENVYLFVECFESAPEKKYIVQSLKRDFSYPKNDAFGVNFDPQCDKSNGFNFTISPLGVQREGLITNGGTMGVTTAWDTKWFSQVKNYNNRWTAEICIPFKALRFKPGNSEWGVNFTRNDLKINESSSWAFVPRSFNIATLSFCGKLIWDTNPTKAGLNVVYIPYSRININNKKLNYQLGGDVKIGVTSSLNLDLTINPDFSEADVDEQVVNLDRFDLFFPEKRGFFQENSDLFSTFGFMRIRPFFSRRIGLYKGSVVPILAGARLSGRLDNNWRVGIMDMQTKPLTTLGLDGQNFSVAAIQRKIGQASNISLITLSRQNTDSIGDYLRLMGFDYNFSAQNSKIIGKTFLHFTQSPIKGKNPYAHASWVRFTTKKTLLEWNHEYVGENYRGNEVGYVYRIGYWRLEPHANYKLYPKSKKINMIELISSMNLYSDTKFHITDLAFQGGMTFNFLSSALFTITINKTQTELVKPFDVTGQGKTPLPVGTYDYSHLKANYSSSFRKPFYYDGYFQYGSYFTGLRINYGGNISYRIQPYVTFGIKTDINQIEMPDSFPDANLRLFGPKVEISFSKNIFFTTWVQYNNQTNNTNINSRLQWRFRPMSDLFIVYNRDVNILSPNNKSINNLIFKFSWWLNN